MVQLLRDNENLLCQENSVIIEWVENEMAVIPGEKDYQIATNFFVTKPELGGYPCSRYTTAEKMLTESDELSVGVFSDILDAVLQQWSSGGTKYSNIYDLKRRVVYVYTKGDFSKYAVFNLEDELKRLRKEERADYNIDMLLYKAAGAEETGGAVETEIAAADGSITNISDQNSSSSAGMPEASSHVLWWLVTLLAAVIICEVCFMLIRRKK